VATKNKYHAKKVTVDGITFDSKKEYNRYRELKLLERAGVISDLKRQVEYELIPAQSESDTVGTRGGVHKGKVIERACKYVADFVYIENGETVVEDVKSDATRTPEYRIKRKLMLYRYGIKIREV
jgi:hypothetical protein